tara:strand:- start:6 stop:1073 length:1068 start_codon:yes stop_codon:yes gene_type:complete
MSAMEESDVEQSLEVNINSFSTGSIAQLAKIFNKGGAGDKDKKEEKKGLLSGMSSGLGKLGIITGLVGIVVGMVKLLVGSSPMLKSILKLFNFGIMLILRPIGDFIGFMLRPIMLMILTKFILPFYQNALPMMQEMGTLVGETLVPWIEKIFLGVIGLGQLIVGKLTFNSKLADEGWANLETAFGVDVAKNIVAVHEIADVVADMDQNNVAAIQTGFADLPKTTEKMAGLSTDMMKFSNSELVKMIGLLGKDNVNAAGVGAANSAVVIAAARGDASTMKELKDIWYKTLMNEGGWTKMPDGKTFNETPIAPTLPPQEIHIVVEGMNGNYTPTEKHEFEMKVIEVVEKERAKRPRR